MSNRPPPTPATLERAYHDALRTTGALAPRCLDDAIVALSFGSTTSLHRVSQRGPRPHDQPAEMLPKKQNVSASPLRPLVCFLYARCLPAPVPPSRVTTSSTVTLDVASDQAFIVIM